MKKMLCFLWFNHLKNQYTQEDAEGKKFRYVASCKCGKHVKKSIPIHDNDLLSNISINFANFPVDEKSSSL